MGNKVGEGVTFSGLKKTYSKRLSIPTKDLIKISFKNLNIRGLVDEIRRTINNASLIVALELKEELDKAMLSKTWPTLRGTDDIYDTGKLLESGRVIIDNDGITITYDAPYAALVHYGGYIAPYGRTDVPRIYLPPRPWVETVMGEEGMANLAKRYKKAIDKQLGGK